MYIFTVAFIVFCFYYVRVGVMSLVDIADEITFSFRFRKSPSKIDKSWRLRGMQYLPAKILIKIFIDKQYNGSLRVRSSYKITSEIKKWSTCTFRGGLLSSLSGWISIKHKVSCQVITCFWMYFTFLFFHRKAPKLKINPNLKITTLIKLAYPSFLVISCCLIKTNNKTIFIEQDTVNAKKNHKLKMASHSWWAELSESEQVCYRKESSP